VVLKVLKWAGIFLACVAVVAVLMYVCLAVALWFVGNKC